jgi:hypothetical protein
MTSPNSTALARIRSPGALPARVTAPSTPMRRTVAVVTHDDALADTVRRAIPTRSVMVVATPVALADLLLQEHTAVLVLDALVPGEHCARLVEHLALQFPELQLIAVGSRADETALGTALSDGRLFRFMHRPYSLARARTFVEAALERYDGHRSSQRDERIRRITSAGFALAAALLVGALVQAPGPSNPPPHAATPRPPPPSRVVSHAAPPAASTMVRPRAHAPARIEAGAPHPATATVQDAPSPAPADTLSPAAEPPQPVDAPLQSNAADAVRHAEYSADPL